MRDGSGRPTSDWQLEKWDTDMLRFVARRERIEVEEVGSILLAKHRIAPAEIQYFPGNMALDEGINAMLHLLIGDGTVTAYNNANANIGVGDTATTEAGTQSGLSAPTNKLYRPMVATYPQIAAGAGIKAVTFRADFTSGQAEWATGWKEWSIANGTAPDGASGGAQRNLNRRVQDLSGTQTKSAATWTLQATFTIPNT